MRSNINIKSLRSFVCLSITYLISSISFGQIIVHTENDLQKAIQENHSNLIIQSLIPISTPLTIPSSVNLIFENSGSLNLQHNLEINGNITSEKKQIFTGDLSKLSGNPTIKSCYPEWFGAKGDGRQNDLKQIQTAIDFYSKVELNKNAVYRIRGNIDLRSNSVINGNDAKILVDGRGSVRIIKSETISISSLVIDFNKTNGFLRIEDASNITIDKCEISNSNHSGLLVKNGKQLQILNSDFSKNLKNGLYLYIVSDFTIKNVRAYENGQFGIYVSGDKEGSGPTQFSENGKIEYCFANKNGSILNGDVHMFSGITLLLARNIEVLNCTSIYNEEHGIVVQSGHDILIDGCISKDNMISGVMIQDFLDDQKILTTEISKNVTVSNSIMENNGKDILNHHQEVMQNGISIHGENENVFVDRVHLNGNRFSSIRTNSARNPTTGLTVKNVIMDKSGKDNNVYKISGATKNVNIDK